MKIKLITDSTVDASKEFLEKYDISYLPQIVNLGGEEYFDTETINTQTIEEFVKKTKKLPKSAARSSEDFKEIYQKYLDSGYDAVICITISSELSCINNNAKLGAEQMPEGKVYVIDSRVLSTGTCLLLLSCADLIKEGKTAKEIVDIVSRRAYSTQVSFVVPTIDYLYKGGRCSAMSAFGANLLKLKPKLQLVDGKIISTAKYRGKDSVVLKKYIDDTLALYNNPDKKRCFVTHADADEEVVKEIVEYVKSKEIFDDVFETKANAVVFSHCGKGTLGILYINDGGNY